MLFKEKLKNEEAQEGASVTLSCELTKGAPVQWKIGPKVLQESDKYQMRQSGTTAELVIRDLEVKDAGDYTCVCGDQKTTATLRVHGKKTLLKLISSSRDRHHSEIQLFLPWVSSLSLFFIPSSSFILFITHFFLRKSRSWRIFGSLLICPLKGGNEKFLSVQVPSFLDTVFSGSNPVVHFSPPQFSPKHTAMVCQAPVLQELDKGKVRVGGAERRGNYLAMDVPDSLKKSDMQSEIGVIISELNSCRLFCL